MIIGCVVFEYFLVKPDQKDSTPETTVLKYFRLHLLYNEK
jgi:hypothetical protein